METGTTAAQVLKAAREEIEKKTGKSPEQLYEEREKRLRDATELREPDRVPIAWRLGYFPLRYVGAPLSAEYYESGIPQRALIKTLMDFEPDAYSGGTNASSGLALQTLGPKYERWPGGDLPSNVPRQILDWESMKEDEYDLFLTDPIDFMLRYHLPRTFKALEPLSKLPRQSDPLTSVLAMSPIFATPEFQNMAQALLKAGQEQAKFRQGEEDIGNLGFPPLFYPGGWNGIPFDWIGDNLRGLKGVMIDMFKRPEKLLAACEKLLEWRLARATPADPAKRGHPRRTRGGTTHWSADRFISKKQFGTFVWPTYKKMLLDTINLGYVPWVHFEGKCDDRWEFFLELPRAKVGILFELGDMARAKAVLGGNCCIHGNLPMGLMQLGSPQEVKEHCKNLIKVCGKGGGFIMAADGNDLSDAKPANVKALVDCVKRYGRY